MKLNSILYLFVILIFTRLPVSDFGAYVEEVVDAVDKLDFQGTCKRKHVTFNKEKKILILIAYHEIIDNKGKKVRSSLIYLHITQ